MRKIHVCKEEDTNSYFLRLFLDAGRAGVIRFETGRHMRKAEADYRAVELSSRHGFERDELPTHPEIESDPTPVEDT